MRLAAHTVFDSSGKPLVFGAKRQGGEPVVIPLYQPKSGLSIYDIWQNERKILNLIKKGQDGGELVLNSCKSYLDAFQDMGVEGTFDAVLEPEQSSAEMADVLNTLCEYDVKPWNKLIARSAIVYNDLQQRGVLANLIKQYPEWSLDTYTGRSKCKGFNVQGEKDIAIQNPQARGDDVFVCFDWSAADIRMAAVFSGDSLLDEMSASGDPYAALAQEIVGLSRDECKLSLLIAINQMDYSAEILKPFPRLQEWIRECIKQLDSGIPLYTVLGRGFKYKDGGKKRAPFNATMQGSIAHAMHSVIYTIWERYQFHLLAEIHDSVVLTCPRDLLNDMIATVVDIMQHPFSGLIATNPVFPVRVSVGKSWRRWQFYKLFSTSRILCV